MLAGNPWFAPALDGFALRAGRFIVTLYGDVVEPRGGRLWMGNVIATCALVGISETLVRTAVSRLVASGKLVGTRLGRKSYYALTDGARAEFAAASRILFDPPEKQGWTFLYLAEANESAVSALATAGFASLAPAWWIGAGGAVPPGIEAITFDAETRSARQGLRALAENHWGLSQCEADYRAFVDRFQPLLAGLTARQALTDAEALTLRLMLVDSFRAIALRGPHLPREALPENWSGDAARALFARLYHALSPIADAYVARHFVSDIGALPRETVLTRRRAETLQPAA